MNTNVIAWFLYACRRDFVSDCVLLDSDLIGYASFYTPVGVTSFRTLPLLAGL